VGIVGLKVRITEGLIDGVGLNEDILEGTVVGLRVRIAEGLLDDT